MAALMMPGARDPDPGKDGALWNGFEDRRDHWLYLFARLKPGISAEAAAAPIDGVFAGIINDVELPGVPRFMRDQFKDRRLVLEPGSQGQRPEREELSQVLLLLLCVTAIVLAIACANVANLLLARAASRTVDMTVRLALGAGRARLVRYLLIESCLLAGAGALGGLIVGAWMLAAIASLMPPSGHADFELDFTLLSFTTAVSAAMALLVGLYPALHSTRRDLVSALQSSTTASAPRATARFRTTLATVQIALSMALLVVAGLFARSLLNMSRVELGIDAAHLVTFRVSPERSGYAPERIRALFDRISNELLAAPGVTGITVSTVPLLAGMASGTNITVEGFNPPPATYMGTVFSRVGITYFHTLGIPLIAGREFSDTDRVGSPKVAIVNEAFARRFNLGAGPIGKRMHMGAGGPLDIEIVGLVKDASYSHLKDPAPSQFFLPHRQQAPPAGELNFYVRSNVPPERIVSMIRPLVARIDGTLPVENLKLMTTQAQATVALDRLIAVLSGGFAALATFLAAIGLFGVLSYTIMQQRREIGVRVALGADVRRVQRMVLGLVGRMTVIGITAGVIAALGLGRLAQSMLFKVEGVDPVVMVCAAAGAAVVAIGAGIVPARRAARVDPMAALRTE
jgi:predicted permease